jgi:hypothetical protein
VSGSGLFSFSDIFFYSITEMRNDFCGPPDILEKCGAKPQYFLVVFSTASKSFEAKEIG